VIGEPRSDSQEEIERYISDRQKASQAEQPEMEAAQASRPGTSEPRVYVVQQGDTLSQIAKSVYGEATRWREIYEANKQKIKDPKIIRPGQELHIP
jgi:nucleoid-associated protein YgaU